MERNRILFQQKSLPADHIAQMTINFIQKFLSSTKKVKPSTINRSLCAKWGLVEGYILKL
ncbi:hypothetical protein RHGRI_015034 [Rhododendron griersonianum]|nr:hypothetical protein RHGRI_015034 [Rhododendron griersonianum]